MKSHKRLGLQAAVLLLLALVTTMAVGKVVFGPLVGSGGSGSASTLGGGGDGFDEAGSGTESAAAGSDPSGFDDGAVARRRADGVVEFAPRGRGGSASARDGSLGEPAGGRFGGLSVRVRFEPTPRLITFLGQLDASLDRDETLASLDKFVKQYGDQLAAEERLGPFTTFLERVRDGDPMIEAVTETMRRHGPSGRAALEAIFDLKRVQYGATLEKYLTEKQNGRSVDSHIYRAQQRIQLLDEVRGELNKSFRFE